MWIQLRPGGYPAANTPISWEHGWGTKRAPIVLNAVRGRGTVVWRGDINAFDVRHLRVTGVTISRTGDSFHCERCSHVQLRRMTLNSRHAAQETIKVNQSDHFSIVNSHVMNAYQNPIDFVAVRYATIRGDRIHGGGDWCAYVKGGSAYIRLIGQRRTLAHPSQGGMHGRTRWLATVLRALITPETVAGDGLWWWRRLCRR